MKPANIPEAITAAASTAKYRVQAHFMAHHAITPNDAIEYLPPGPRERKEFDRLRRAEIIRQSMPAYYWLDMTRLDAEERRQERRKGPIAIVAAIVLAAFVMTFYEG